MASPNITETSKISNFFTLALFIAMDASCGMVLLMKTVSMQERKRR